MKLQNWLSGQLRRHRSAAIGWVATGKILAQDWLRCQRWLALQNSLVSRTCVSSLSFSLCLLRRLHTAHTLTLAPSKCLRVYVAATRRLSGPPFSLLTLFQRQQPTSSKMVKSQRMRVANEKASKNVTQRGNVPKSTVSRFKEPGQLVTRHNKTEFVVMLINWPICGPHNAHLFTFVTTFTTEKRRRQVPGWTMAARSLYLCRLWLCTFADHPEYSNGLKSIILCYGLVWRSHSKTVQVSF